MVPPKFQSADPRQRVSEVFPFPTLPSMRPPVPCGALTGSFALPFQQLPSVWHHGVHHGVHHGATITSRLQPGAVSSPGFITPPLLQLVKRSVGVTGSRDGFIVSARTLCFDTIATMSAILLQGRWYVMRWWFPATAHIPLSGYYFFSHSISEVSPAWLCSLCAAFSGASQKRSRFLRSRKFESCDRISRCSCFLLPFIQSLSYFDSLVTLPLWLLRLMDLLSVWAPIPPVVRRRRSARRAC